VAALVSYLPGQQTIAAEGVTLLNQIEAPLSPARDRVFYSVVEGESLWSIARRLYGDGTQYVMLFRENHGSQMPTGAAFMDPRTIESGSRLMVPMPTPNLWSSEAHVLYRVQPGDSLWRIAESFLGDGFRWMEVWKLNQGQTMADGRQFHDPDLIFPGWVLQIPGAITPAPPREPARPEVEPAETPPIVSVTQIPEPEPTAAADNGGQPIVRDPNGRDDGDGITPSIPFPGVVPVLLSAAGIVSAGMTFLLVRALARRATASGTRARSRTEKPVHPRGDAGRVVLASRALLSALSEHGFEDSRLIFIREAPRYQDFFIECPPGDADALARGRHDLGRRLACGVEAEVESQTQVRLRLSRFQRLAGLLIEDSEAGTLPLLVPAGGEDGSVYYLNLAAAGTVLVAGTSEQTSQLLSGWLQTLAATFRPDELSVLLDQSIEHQLAGQAALEIVQSTEARSSGDLFDEIADMIVAREKASDTDPQAMVLAMAKVNDPDYLDPIETVYRHGRETNIALVVLVGSRSDIDPGAVTGARVAFSSSLLAEQSVESLGDSDLVLSVGRRPPVALHAIAVRTEVVPLPPANMNESDFADVDFETFAPEQDDEQPWPGGAAEAEPFEAEEEPTPVAVDSAEEDSLASDDVEPDAEGQIPLGLVSGRESAEADGESSWASDPLFAVRCFGAFEVTFEGKRVDWRITKSRELLAFLLVQRATTVQRETVMEALWPDALSSQVEHMLSNATYYLRNSLRVAANGRKDIQVIFAPRQRCQLQSSLFRSDADAFDAHLRRAAGLQGTEALLEYERGLNLYRGDLFGKEPFEWATAFRLEFQRRFLGAAHQAARLALECRDAARAIGFYRAILDHDPIDEEAARGLMQVYGNEGDANGVKKVYKVLCESLRQELGDAEAQPMPDTEALLQELTRQSVRGKPGEQ
jgi:DNA-binding SARP family transcriptional activator/LysM repeat protein